MMKQRWQNVHNDENDGSWWNKLKTMGDDEKMKKMEHDETWW